MFQFLIGSLEAGYALYSIKDKLTFQFLIGSLEAVLISPAKIILASFNSS